MKRHNKKTHRYNTFLYKCILVRQNVIQQISWIENIINSSMCIQMVIFNPRLPQFFFSYIYRLHYTFSIIYDLNVYKIKTRSKQLIRTNLSGIILGMEQLFLYFIHNILCFRCQKLIVSLDPFLCVSSHAVFIIVERFLLPQAISLPVKINTLLYRSKKFIIVVMMINKHPTFCKEISINESINGYHSLQIKLHLMYIFT